LVRLGHDSTVAHQDSSVRVGGDVTLPRKGPSSLSVLIIRPTVENPTATPGKTGSITVDWRPAKSAWISLFTETNSLFLITGNLTLRPRKRSGISDLIRPEKPEIEEIPCIFPA